MKTRIHSLFLTLLSFSFLTACANVNAIPMPTPPVWTGSPISAVQENPASAGNISSGEVINLWSFTDEVPLMVEKYKQVNPDFNYDINVTIISTTDGEYQPALDKALMENSENTPDLFTAEAAFVIKYTQGDMAHFAAPYADLGIDVPNALSAAHIATYASDIGTRGDGMLVGLPYQATGGAFIYRRSIATDVWGTDDPDIIKDKIGPGWEKFLDAAALLKNKGYAIVSGDGDIWHPLENNSANGWIKDGKLFIDPGRELFMDLAKILKDNDYMNNTADWQDEWFADMKDEGPKKVFGFFGPAWLINYVLAGNSGGEMPGEGTFGDWAVCEPTNGFSWGGTWLIVNKDSDKKDALRSLIEWITLDTSETGLQYKWANGTLNGPGGTKDTVSSGAVMEKSNGRLDFLGGQNMFDVFVPAGENATGTNKTQYDETINSLWREQVRAYTSDEKSRDEALFDFKLAVFTQLAIPSDDISEADIQNANDADTENGTDSDTENPDTENGE